ncbi:MAG TPA: ROK family protein [Gaiellaceae bacterium]|nr:ROK family protein [Gaiellaceae bacterium]
MPPSGFFAVDVGASWVKSGTVVDGRATGIAREPVAHGLDALVAQLVRLHRDAGEPPWGLCVAGLVDRRRGVLRYSANLGLEEAPLVELLETAPVVFANDLDAAAIGEADGGTLALLQVGTGIAGRHVVEGEVPTAELAGELGHLRFREGGLSCRCGRSGCAEAYGSWAGIERRYEQEGRPRPEPGPLLAEAQTDDWTRGVLDDALDALGFAAAALVAVTDPGTLRLGGGVAAAWGETLLTAVRAALEERVLPQLAAATTVECATLGDAAALVGLATFARA